MAGSVVEDGREVGEVDRAIVVGIAEEADVEVDKCGVAGGVEGVNDIADGCGEGDVVRERVELVGYWMI